MALKDPSSTFLVMVNFTNTSLCGALSLLGMATAVSSLGLTYFLIASVLWMGLTYFSIVFLCETAEMSQCFSMHSLSKHYLGKFASTITLIVITVGNWSVLVNIFQIFADFIPAFLRDWTDINAVHFLGSRYFAVVVGTLLTLPWIAVHNISDLTPLSALSMSLGVTAILVMLSNAIQCAIDDSVSDSLVYVEASPLSIFRGLSAVAWCWAIHFNVLPIYASLDSSSSSHPSADLSADLTADRKHEMRVVTMGTVLTTLLLFVTEGVAVYVVWGARVDFDFLLNLSHSDPNYIFFFSRWLSTLMQFVICVACLGSVPLLTFAARENLDAMVRAVRRRLCNGGYRAVTDAPDDEEYLLIDSSSAAVAGDGEANSNLGIAEIATKEQSTLWRLIEGSALVLSAALVALFFTKLNDAIALAGSTYVVYMAFLLPSALYLKATTQSEREWSVEVRRKRIIAVFQMVFGCVVGIGGVTAVLVHG